MTRAAYERGRSDAAACAHVRSSDDDYLRGYAEGIIGIPGSPSIDVHIARSDAWAGRAPTRTDAAYLLGYEREIQDCLDRTTHGTDEWLRKEGLADAVRRQPPRTRTYSAYLRGYADAAAVLLGAPAKVPTPAQVLGQPPVPPPQQPRPAPAAPAQLTPKTMVAPTPAKNEPSPPKGPTVGPRETLLEVD